VAGVELNLLSREDQTGENRSRVVTVGDAVSSGAINNETLAYYMARTQLFLVHIGVDRRRLRFRQHLSTEMAHYAECCWDAELFGSYGWIECVGHADRSAYDLKVHTDKSKVELVAQETFDQPRIMEVATIKTNHALLGKTFGKHPSYKLLVNHTTHTDTPSH
jgi:glycyl-tRNA synthetase